jgi:hypothetical protein
MAMKRIKIVIAVFLSAISIGCSQSQNAPNEIITSVKNVVTTDKDVIDATKLFLEKVCTNDPASVDIIDFEQDFEINKTNEQKVLNELGKEKLEQKKIKMAANLSHRFVLMKDKYMFFSDFKVEKKGENVWKVSFLDDEKQSGSFQVKNRNGKLKVNINYLE